jgi:dipeptidyl aminopeptidase/acylaminoacyl peptidase
MRAVVRLRNLLLLVALGLVAIAATAGPAAATHPGANGRIVFANGTNGIWSVLPDGSGLELLTTVVAPPGIQSFVSFPSFSADGSKLAVMLTELNVPTPCDPSAINAGSGLCHVLMLMNADGSNQRVVYASEDVASLDLALSPDGSTIAFTKVTSSFSEQLFTIGADGKHLRLLTPQRPHEPATDTGPSWSPDGRTIAFESSRDQALTGNGWSLFSVDVRTRRVDRIIPASLNNDLEQNWSPDGSKLTLCAPSAFRITASTPLTGTGTASRRSWAISPQQKAPCGRPTAARSCIRGTWAVWFIVNADGSNPHQIVSSVIRGYSWEPLP